MKMEQIGHLGNRPQAAIRPRDSKKNTRPGRTPLLRLLDFTTRIIVSASSSRRLTSPLNKVPRNDARQTNQKPWTYNSISIIINHSITEQYHSKRSGAMKNGQPCMVKFSVPFFLNHVTSKFLALFATSNRDRSRHVFREGNGQEVSGSLDAVETFSGQVPNGVTSEGESQKCSTVFRSGDVEAELTYSQASPRISKIVICKIMSIAVWVPSLTNLWFYSQVRGARLPNNVSNINTALECSIIFLDYEVSKTRHCIKLL